MSQGPLKWVEESTPVSKGFAAGPEHTETIVNLTLGYKDTAQESSVVAGTEKALTSASPPVGTAAREVEGAETEHGCLVQKWQAASSVSMLQQCLWQVPTSC